MWNSRIFVYPTCAVLLKPSARACNLSKAVCVRFYRGEAGQGVPSLSAEEEALLKIAKPRSEEMLKKHFAMPTLEKIPVSSWDPAVVSNDNVSIEEKNLEIRRKRLIYRSKQRGWLEVDLLLGTWASLNVPHLNADELDQFEDFVNQETIDIYNIITLRLDVPDEQKTGDSIVERIQQWARESPLGKADPEKYKSVKTDRNLI